VVIDGEARGEVTSGSFAPFLKINIARAYLPSGSSGIDTEVEVDVRGRRLRAKVVKTPFYRRPRR
jgi:aminomethyltransferase